MRVLKAIEGGKWTLTKDLSKPPGPYAILSHTWGADEDEVTYDDAVQNSGTAKAGMAKLQFCANQAVKDGLEYFWIDTCCINKANHVELSEAITSMFRWYHQSAKCYVYLSDVSSGGGTNEQAQHQWEPAFRKSRWFTRGWTLQELLAPEVVEFYSQERQYLGTKTTLELLIHDITEIPLAALHGAPLSQFTIDERLRWTNGRNTAKIEDNAYCLLGIFDMSMSLRYGEGNKALSRLEKKIRGFSKLQHDLIDWLAPSRCQAFHARASLHRLPGTGTFFTDGPFLSWLGEDVRRGSLMWINGKSGAGKTTLFSCIVEATKTHTLELSAQVYAYHYCAISEPESRQLVNILGSFVAQISAWQPGILDGLKGIFEGDIARKRDKTLQVWELEQLLVQHVAIFSTVIFLVDAVNESEDLLNTLACLVRLLQQLPNLKVLITSTTRAPAGVTHEEFHLTEIQIYPDEDIQTYVEFQLLNHVALRDLGSEHRERVKSTLVNKADQSFRWVSLTIENLRRQRTGKAVLETLMQIPEGLNNTYGTMLNMISSTDKTIAREALLWLCFTVRPLSMLELSEAAVLGDADTTLSEESRLHRPEDILDICNGFIEHNKENNEVKLAHSSVREYLLSDNVKDGNHAFFSLKIDEGNRTLMRRCLTYLMFDDFKCYRQPETLHQMAATQLKFRPLEYTLHEMAARRQKFPLLDYAALNWGQHATYVTKSEWSLAHKLFATKSLPYGGNYGSWLSYLIPEYHVDSILYTAPLYYAASFGIVPLVRALVAEAQPGDLEQAGGRSGSTALQVACFRGRKEAAKCLLYAGADFWTKDRGSGMPAWFWAHSNGWTSMVDYMAQLKPNLVKHMDLRPEDTQRAQTLQRRLGVDLAKG